MTGTTATFSGDVSVNSTNSKTGGTAWNLNIRDNTALAANVGGGISFQGVYTTGGSIGNFGAISSYKTNATSGNESGGLRLYYSANGIITQGLQISETGAATFQSVNAKVNTGGWHVLVQDNTSMAAGVGGGISFNGYKTGTSAQGVYAAIDGIKENGTAGDELGAFRIWVSNGTNLVERLRIASNGDITTTSNVKATNFNITAESGFRGGLFPYKLVSGAGVDMGMTLFAEGGTNNGNIYFCVNGSVTKAMTIATTGAVTIAGSLSKGSGSFRIDHPLKPDTHQLVHSFIEGPQADLIYRGKLTLVNGKAQANIDEVSTMTEGTFEALCREVQCFTTNENGWDLVKGKVIGNIIYIESQNPNSTDEISWMVIGERKDTHMMDTKWTDEQGKVIVEPLKA